MQNQKTADQAAQVASTNATGNADAAQVAAKADALMQAISPALTPKLRDLPTKKERLLALADAIERHELVKQNIGFNMRWWKGVVGIGAGSIFDRTGHSCGTVACIAGWADIIDKNEMGGASYHGGDSVSDRAAYILGLTEGEATTLFHANGSAYGITQITVQHAVAVLRDFANNGFVRWHAFDSTGKKIA